MDFNKRIWKMTAEELIERADIALLSLYECMFVGNKRREGNIPLYDQTIKILEKLGFDHGTALHLIERKLEKPMIRVKPKSYRLP